MSVLPEVTLTHTVYFTHDDIAPLRAEAQTLRADYERRRPHMSEQVRDAYGFRLNTLDAALRMLAEPVLDT